MSKWIVAALACILALSLGQAVFAAEEATPNTSVTGKVLMPDGSPAAGATVELHNLYWDRTSRASGTTDQSGAFKISPPPGKYLLRAVLGTLVVEDRSTLVTAEAGTPVGPFELKLAKGIVVSGIVTEKATGKPVDGARVITESGDTTDTSATGSYSLVLPRDGIRISAVKEGFCRPMIIVPVTDQETFNCPIELKPGGTIKGKVTGKEGKPIAGAAVSRGYYFYFQSTKTNANGEYSLLGVDPDTQTQVHVRADGYERPEASAVFAAGQMEVTLDFPLKALKTRNVAGRVTLKSGKPVVGATVDYGMGTAYADRKTATTDADGKYAMEVTSTYKNVVMAQAKGLAPAFGFVPANEDAVVNLVMEPGHSVEGQFEDDEGNPLNNVRIDVSADNAAMQATGQNEPYMWIDEISTDAKGHFRLDDLPPDGVTVQAYKKGYTELDGMPLKAGTKDLIIVMYPAGIVSGKVVSAEDDSPIKKFKLVGERNIGPMQIDSSNGTFTKPSPYIGAGDKVQIGIESPGYVRQMKTLEARAKVDFNSAVFRLKRSHEFGGTITDSEGRPIEGVRVTASQSMRVYSYYWTEIPPVRTDSGGHFAIADMPIEWGDLTLEKPGYGKLMLANMDLKKPLAASMEKGAVIFGTITDETGKPLPKVHTMISQKRDQTARTDSDDKGGIRFEDLAPGTYRVEANDTDNNRLWLCMAEVKSGDVYEIDWHKPGEAQLEGKVTRLGKPVAGAYVSLYAGVTYYSSATGRTNENGDYSMNVARAGRYRVSSYKEEAKLQFTFKYADMTVIPGKNHLDLQFPGASLSGKVFDQSTKKPIANATVRCYIRMTAEQSYRGSYWENQFDRMYESSSQAKTDGQGRFKFTNLESGPAVVVLDLEDTRIPGEPVVNLGNDEQRTGVTVKIPATGEAHVKIVDDATGKPLPDVPLMSCLDERGFRFAPAGETVGTGQSTKWKLVRTPEGKFVIPDLPPGKYTLYVPSDAYLSPPTAFRVKANETTEVSVRMRKTQRIVFKLVGDHPPRESLNIGFRITSMGGEPVLTNYQGPCYGDLTYFRETNDAGIPIAPGTYRLEAALIYAEADMSRPSKDSLWTTKQTVTVQKGRDTVIEIKTADSGAK